MIYIILLILAISLMLFKYLYSNSKRVIYFKNSAIILLCCLFILCLVVFSNTALEAARKGINLCLNIVFPSLFPFFVGSELLYKTGLVKAMGFLFEPVMRPLFNVPGCASFTFAMGITSGYPLGAKLTVNMRKEKLLTKTEAERLIAFTNNSGPLFIIGAVAAGMYKLPKLGFLLLGCHILASVTVGLIFRFYGRKNTKLINQRFINPINNTTGAYVKFKEELKKSITLTNLSFGTILGDALKNSIGLLLSIGGFIVFFSVIINLLLTTGIINYLTVLVSFLLAPAGISREIIPAVISGFFEITTGSFLASTASGVSLIVKLTAASVIIGWAGLSVHSQVLSILSGSDINIKPYLTGKLLQGIISGIYTFLIIKIAGTALISSKPAFSTIYSTRYQYWNNNLSISVISFVICILVLFVIILISLRLNGSKR